MKSDDARRSNGPESGPGENEPACPTCRGAGAVYSLPRLEALERAGERNYNQAIILCPTCGPGRRQVYLQKICRLDGEMLTWGLDAFWLRQGRGEAPRRAALEALERGCGWLTYWGEKGVGKTYLLAAIVNEARRCNVAAIYVTMAELLDSFRAAFAPEAETGFDTLWHRVRSVRVLAIDELEKFNATPWAEERFFMLVEWRYRHAHELLTIFATNQAVKPGCTLMSDGYAPGYLESRLLDGRFQVVEVTGGDVRPGLRRPDDL